jgi:hypothetical protein
LVYILCETRINTHTHARARTHTCTKLVLNRKIAVSGKNAQQLACLIPSDFFPAISLHRALHLSHIFRNSRETRGITRGQHRFVILKSRKRRARRNAQRKRSEIVVARKLLAFLPFLFRAAVSVRYSRKKASPTHRRVDRQMKMRRHKNIISHRTTAPCELIARPMRPAM